MGRKLLGLAVVLAVAAVVAYRVSARPPARGVAASPVNVSVPASGSAPAPAPAPASASAPAPAPAAPAPTPHVTVTNIGMHIGGGPNDAPTKDPIARSVSPHFDDFAGCWSAVDDPTRAGDFGVDLLIPAHGGKATVSHPRTRLGPDAFRNCVIAAFENIEFLQPKTGKTTVSYSLQFTP